MKISTQSLRDQVIKTLEEGFSTEESTQIADYLVWAEMSGVHTQGIVKLTGPTALQLIKPEHGLEIDRETKLSQRINAGNTPAPLTGQLAAERAVAKAKEHGFGIIGVHNVQSSNGAQAFYAELISQHDLIGITLARTPAAAAAFGGIDPVFGTDPIGFSFPTDDGPLTFDMATTAMTVFGLIIAKAKGEQIPENIAIDSDGNPTTDPAAALDGALRSFDRSYKGSGLEMVVEILGGPLVGAAYAQKEGEWGELFIAIDPELLIDLKQFKTNTSDLVRKLKAARTKNGDQVRLPGERAKAAFAAAEQSGEVEIDDTVAEQLGFKC